MFPYKPSILGFPHFWKPPYLMNQIPINVSSIIGFDDQTPFFQDIEIPFTGVNSSDGNFYLNVPPSGSANQDFTSPQKLWTQ